MRSSVFLAALVAALVAGCGGGDNESDQRAVAITQFDDTGTRVFPAGAYVVRSEQAWSALWASSYDLFGDTRPVPLPAIDFSRKILVAASAAMGPGCDGRFADIDKAYEDGRAVYVEYQIQLEAKQPPPGISCHGTIFIPLKDFVLIDATTKEVVLVPKKEG